VRDHRTKKHQKCSENAPILSCFPPREHVHLLRMDAAGDPVRASERDEIARPSPVDQEAFTRMLSMPVALSLATILPPCIAQGAAAVIQTPVILVITPEICPEAPSDLTGSGEFVVVRHSMTAHFQGHGQVVSRATGREGC
jgi:hypothetical protein